MQEWMKKGCRMEDLIVHYFYLVMFASIKERFCSNYIFSSIGYNYYLLLMLPTTSVMPYPCCSDTVHSSICEDAQGCTPWTSAPSLLSEITLHIDSMFSGNKNNSHSVRLPDTGFRQICTQLPCAGLSNNNALPQPKQWFWQLCQLYVATMPTTGTSASWGVRDVNIVLYFM